MIIQSSTKNYQVNIFNDFTPVNSLNIDDKTFFVIDKVLYNLYKDELFCSIPENQLYILEAVEDNKRIETALEICEIMTRLSSKRNTTLVSFGGGIVQDVTGFVSNILYRGINWIFFPTTLLAACDSCIGGKTSLNYKKFKNLLGTFFPPNEIIICTPFFKTLSEKDFQSGLGEVVKFNVMFGDEGIANMENNIDALLRRDENKLEQFVENSLLFKRKFIEEDEFDKGVRIHLNFAHTFGHAFETMSHYEIPHGTAVAMGTIVANHISLSRGWLTQERVDRIENVLWKIIHIDTDTIQINMDEIISAIQKDKKQIGKELTAVLLKDDMKLQIVHDITQNEIEISINYIFDKLKNNS